MGSDSNQPRKSGSETGTKKRTRSKAQIEASRKNGAKGKGPTSENGKMNSRRNALKHGLAAKFLKPARGPRKQDQLFEQVYYE